MPRRCRLAAVWNSWPAAVSRIARAALSKSETPSQASSVRTCWLIAPGVTNSSAAASRMLPWRAAASKERTAFRGGASRSCRRDGKKWLRNSILSGRSKSFAASRRARDDHRVFPTSRSCHALHDQPDADRPLGRPAAQRRRRRRHDGPGPSRTRLGHAGGLGRRRLPRRRVRSHVPCGGPRRHFRRRVAIRVGDDRVRRPAVSLGPADAVDDDPTAADLAPCPRSTAGLVYDGV